VVALGKISTRQNGGQQDVDGIVAYLAKHGQHVRDVELWGVYEEDSAPDVTLHQLPQILHKLTSLQLHFLTLQLQHVLDQGVIEARAPLTRLQLDMCELPRLDGEVGLHDALMCLSSLHDLKLNMDPWAGPDGEGFCFGKVFAVDVMRELQQLTHLKLTSLALKDPHDLKQLKELTGLHELDLCLQWPDNGECDITADMLSSLQRLTRLVVRGYHESGTDTFPTFIELGVLTHLQHLELLECWSWRNGSAESPIKLLAQLGQLQQLIYLSLSGLPVATPATTYSALTASSKLQHLEVCDCELTTDAWRHVFSAGRQLPHMQRLIITTPWHQEPNMYIADPVGTDLVSCCPGLRSLQLVCAGCDRELLAPLTGLTGLTHMVLKPGGEGWPYADEEWMEWSCVSQLTGLKELDMAGRLTDENHDSFFVKSTQLHQLTNLRLDGKLDGKYIQKSYFLQVRLMRLVGQAF
jgi:hypothetical protein